MKKQLLLICLLAVAAIVSLANAQNYYKESFEKVIRDGVSYKCISNGGSVKFYNSANKMIDIPWAHKDGSPIPMDVRRGSTSTIEVSVGSILSIIDNSFTPEMRTKLRGLEFVFFVTIYYNTTTGRIQEVFFRFELNSPFAEVSPATYALIERTLKDNIQAEITPAGKKLNYICYSGTHVVR